MLKTKNKLTILDDNNSVFYDHSTSALDYSRDSFPLTLNALTSFLIIGFNKPINAAYVEILVANENVGTMTGEYYNGTDWEPLNGFFDETASLTRSGFVQWERNQTDETKTTIDGNELFFYRFRPSVTHNLVIVRGINIVFSDDTDLKTEFFEIADFLPNGETSHILSHVASRNQIIQHIRNAGITKSKNGTKSDISAFDLHDVGQIKLASTYLTLSKIFGAVTDDPDGNYKDKSVDFHSKYSIAIKTPFIDIDSDDDGIRDNSENKQIRTLRIFRE